MNENGEHLVDVCAERGLFLTNTFFQHKMIHWYTWRRWDDRGEQKSLIDYIAVGERLKKDVHDAKVVGGVLEGSDHYAVVVQMTVRDKWEFNRKNGKEKRSKVLAKERLEKEEIRKEYTGKLSERLRGGLGQEWEKECVNDVYDIFKGTIVMEVADEVEGWRESGVGKKRECMVDQ